MFHNATDAVLLRLDVLKHSFSLFPSLLYYKFHRQVIHGIEEHPAVPKTCIAAPIANTCIFVKIPSVWDLLS